MDAETRTLLKQAIDERRRRSVAESGLPMCPYCGQEFTPLRSTQKFCSPDHRKWNWFRTPRGKEFRKRQKLQWTRRKRAAEKAARAAA